MKKKGQLTLEDRAKLQAYLEDEIPISVICKKLGVVKQTIYREIKRNGIEKNKNIKFRIMCEHIGNCPFIGKGRNCKEKCHHFIQKQCKKVIRFPFICNKCTSKLSCKLPHRYYYASKAQENYEKKLRETRSGLRITEEEFEEIDSIVSPLLKEKGQSLNHILTSHPEILVCERTIRNWINDGYTSAGNIDLPRKVSFKPRKEYIHRITKPSDILEGRTYHDFKVYCKKNPSLLVCQLDTVIGKLSDENKVLTIHFPVIHFQFGILIKGVSPNEVNKKLLNLRNAIGKELWKKIFPIILTDNGVEFNKLNEIEIDEDGELLSKVFYCNPYCSSQKGACERNHELFRYIEPKYYSLDHLDQDKLDIIFSNINSYYRPSLNGICPYDLALAILGKKFLDSIHIKKIEPNLVNMTQSLIKNIKI